MLTVPTTPMISVSGLPGWGGWTGVCLHLSIPPGTVIPKGESEPHGTIQGAIGSPPGLRPISKSP